MSETMEADSNGAGANLATDEGAKAAHSPGIPRGLSQNEVEKLRLQYGENKLPEPKRISPLSILLSQFKSPLIYVILAAAIISLVMGEFTDFLIIMAVVVFDVVLGFFQEYQASVTYESLKSLVKPVATVIRDGKRKEVEVKELVPQDIVLLDTGDKVPADGVLLESRSISVNESILTGESESVVKSENDPVYMGTTVVTGRGTMMVTATGLNTSLGKIAHTIGENENEETPLQKRLAHFSHTLTRLVIAVSLVMYVIGLLAGKNPLDMARVVIILAVAAIPEGLLIAVTVILVLGMKRVLNRQGLVKRLLAVETLGSVTVICTDKTGTLTKGQMSLTNWEFKDKDMAMKILVLNNNLSDSLEVALWDFAKTEKMDPEKLVARYPKLDEEPFSSEKKYMKTLHSIDGERFVLLKGAPEVVLQKSLGDDKKRYQKLADSWAEQGLRLLALAYKKLPDGATFDSEEADSGFTFAGILGLQDPIRPEVPEAIATCRRAGIQVKMITGDHRKTALRIAKLAGLSVDESNVIEGTDLDKMDDEQLRQRINDIVVFARILPHQKLRIVSTLQSLGHVVAMVGDGVNDAPALKKSDIGVVVGTASDVAKETADLVLLDSNFRTIVAAVEEGRVVFQNIKKVVSYTLSNSFAEILLVFVSMLLNWPAPLTVAQILWIHLICDGPVDIVLGFEPKENGIMEEKPRPVSEPILGGLGISLIGAISGTAAAGCLLMFGHYWLKHGDILLARTLSFETLAIISLVYVFAYRSLRYSIFHTPKLLSNKPLLISVLLGFATAFAGVAIPGLRSALNVVTLHPAEWAMVFGLSFLLLVIVETGKYVALAKTEVKS